MGFLGGLRGLPRWPAFLDRLAERRRVVAPSLPGFPGATGHDRLDDIADWVSATLDLLEESGLEGADLVGASVGGALCAEVAAFSHASVRRLVLIAPLGLFDEQDPVADIWAQRLSELPALLSTQPEELAAFLEVPEGGDAIEWQILLSRANEAAARLLWPIGDCGLHKRLHRIVADTLLLWGSAAAERPATETHPFGYARERYFWSFVVALVIFSLGALFATYEGIQKLLHPHPLENPIWAFGVLGGAIGIEGWSFRTAVVEALTQKSSDEGWWAFIRRTKNPELPVVLLEDFGALCGLVLALLGVTLSVVTGNPEFDALGSIGIGVLLGVIAVVLAIEMKSLLIGEAASNEDQQTIRRAVLAGAEVRHVIHMRTQHFGPDQLLIAAKVEFDRELSFAELATAINDAEARIRTAVPEAGQIYLEPDIYVSSPAAPLR